MLMTIPLNTDQMWHLSELMFPLKLMGRRGLLTQKPKSLSKSSHFPFFYIIGYLEMSLCSFYGYSEIRQMREPLQMSRLCDTEVSHCRRGILTSCSPHSTEDKTCRLKQIPHLTASTSLCLLPSVFCFFLSDSSPGRYC